MKLFLYFWKFWTEQTTSSSKLFLFYWTNSPLYRTKWFWHDKTVKRISRAYNFYDGILHVIVCRVRHMFLWMSCQGQINAWNRLTSTNFYDSNRKTWEIKIIYHRKYWIVLSFSKYKAIFFLPLPFYYILSLVIWIVLTYREV